MSGTGRIFSILFLTITLITGALLFFFSVFHAGYKVSGYFIMAVLFDIIYLLALGIACLFKLGKKTIENISVVIISILITILLTEFLLRKTNTFLSALEAKYSGKYISPFQSQFSGWYDLWQPKSTHELKNTEFCFRRNTNSIGLSDEEHPLVKQKGEFRTLALGDSYTEGDGADADSTWLKFLERNIRNAYGISNLTFINAGACGSDPYEELKLLSDKLLPFKPDLVIVTINTGDVTDILCRGGMERFQSDSTLKFRDPPAWEALYAQSYLFRLIIHKLFNYNYLFIPNSDYKNEYQKALSLLIQSLKNFKDEGLENHFRLLVIFHPFKWELDKGSYGDFGSIMDTCRSLNIDCFDLLQYFRNSESFGSHNSQQLYWKIDGHHNATGYDAFARGVGWKLKQMGIIGKQ